MKQICCWKNYWLTFSNLLLISPHPLRKKKLSSYDLHKYTTAFLTWQFPFWVFKIFFRFVRSFSLKLKFWALQNDLFDSKICILEISIWNVVVFNMAFNFACFVYLWKRFVNRIWVKSKNGLFDSKSFKINDEILELLIVFILFSVCMLTSIHLEGTIKENHYIPK